MKILKFILFAFLVSSSLYAGDFIIYGITDTEQTQFFNNNNEISPPNQNERFYGQDAGNFGIQPIYKDLENGVIFDFITGLYWQKFLFEEKYTYEQAKSIADTITLGGFNDWRIPSAKELFSLINYNGIFCDEEKEDDKFIPFINTNYFDFRYGFTNLDEKYDEVLYLTSTEYNNDKVFAVNFATGKLSAYSKVKDDSNFQKRKFELRLVRGNPKYGINNLVDNNDGTITDNATQIMWSKDDSKDSMIWEDALKYVQAKNRDNYLGYNDWMLPNIKELQSIIDYSEYPPINEIFNYTELKDTNDNVTYPYYWSSTTHKTAKGAKLACYITIDKGYNWYSEDGYNFEKRDIDGYGAVRSDLKIGATNLYPFGVGYDKRVVRIYNYVRLARYTFDPTSVDNFKTNINAKIFPNPVKDYLNLNIAKHNYNTITISITNIIGNKIYEKRNFTNQNLIINTDNFNPGIYFINISNGKNSTILKFVKI